MTHLRSPSPVSPAGSRRASPVNRRSQPAAPPKNSRKAEAKSSLPASGPLDASAPVDGLRSLPMTASSSSASAEVAPAASTTTATNTPLPIDANDLNSAGAPYGTRSRGRNGAPRPNYAEDRDIDMDFEVTSPAPRASSRSKRGASQSAAQDLAMAESSDTKGPAASTRRNQQGQGQAQTQNQGQKPVSTNVNGTTTQGAAKESIPGTSTFSAHLGSSAANNSRKRKQPSGASTAAATPTSTGSTSKRGQTAASATDATSALDRSYSNMMTFEKCGSRLKNGKLKADDGTVLAVNDHVYLICEPPGEPYYLARIMEFLPSKESSSGVIEALRVNWYYRPRDIQRAVTDTRLVFASMHSDTCPLLSLRGKCSIFHVSEIHDMEEYRKQRDAFWYDKMFDRYMHRYYEVIPTSKVINVPENVKKVLDERWKFVLVEMGRRKELTSAVKLCKRCGQYAANTDSVDCAVCHCTYHMLCVRPPLTKKPARGFAWACAACSRAQERKLEARNTPIIGEKALEPEDEIVEEEEEDANALPPSTTGRSSPATADEKVTHPRPATAEQTAQARMWPYRYLGIHCRVEDALDYDDRIYPRASSRLGPRHQATVNNWEGHAIEYVKPPEKKKISKSGGSRSNGKQSKEAAAALEAERLERLNRPKWVLDAPPGWIQRGEDEPVSVDGKQIRTAQLLFKMPEPGQIPVSNRGEEDAPGSEMSLEEREKFIDDYMERARAIFPSKGLPTYSTNFLDKALEYLYSESFNADAALAKLKRVDIYKDLHEPQLSPEQVKRFEEGVAKYGSELLQVRRHVGNIQHRHIVRYYYMWKKTPKGRQIWGNYEGRRGKKEAKRTDSSTAKLVDDVADDHDDSAFDNDKAVEKKRGFQCKFCSTRTSPQWRRAPGVAPGTSVPADSSKRGDKGNQLCVALCLRCALLWRKYGIQWENVEEIAKKIGAGGNKAWRRRMEEEMLAQLLVSEETPTPMSSSAAATAASIGVNVPSATSSDAALEPAKKRARTTEKDGHSGSAHTSVEPAPKKKPAEKPAAPAPDPIDPDPPRAKTLPCAVCNQMDPMGDARVSCRDCRMTVHKSCYGVNPARICTKWLCDMCLNDRNPMLSTCYECVLCPVTWTEHELMEPPRTSNKKSKTDRDREKERLEKEMVQEAIKLYRQRQEAAGKPIGPREPLKRTVGNNWVHVLCAIWNPETRFGEAKDFEPVEGFELIPPDRYRETCKICKTTRGSCVPCQFSGCTAQFHVGCAFHAGYTFGFDIVPVKSTRRDTVSTIKLGEEAGAATAAIWCPNHTVPTIIHEMTEPTEKGLIAMQLYAQTYKQADLTLTGTVRRAALVQQIVGAVHTQSSTSSSTNRRASTTNGTVPKSSPPPGEGFDDANPISEVPGTVASQSPDSEGSKQCVSCSATVSPRWWPTTGMAPVGPGLTNGAHISNGVISGDMPSNRFQSAPPPPVNSSHIHARSQSQGSVSKINGDYNAMNVRPSTSSFAGEGMSGMPSVSPTAYECHKCHIKKPTQPSPERVAEPYSQSQRGPLLPAPRLTEQPQHSQPHPYGPPPASHLASQPSVLHRPIGPGPPQHASEWYPSYDQRPPGDPNYRHAMGANGPLPPQPNGYQPPAGYRGPPPPPVAAYPAMHTVGHVPPPPSAAPASAPSHASPRAVPAGPPPHAVPHPPPHPAHFPGAGPPPPPHAYTAHQSPYAPVGNPSPLTSHTSLPRHYGPSASPPDMHANLVRPSQPHSLSGGPPHPPPPPPRGYGRDIERGYGPPVHSPLISRGSVDPQLPSTPSKVEDAARPSSSGRYGGTSGSGAGTGASASPSLKNLLS